jgi:hypothetical protein
MSAHTRLRRCRMRTIRRPDGRVTKLPLVVLPGSRPGIMPPSVNGHHPRALARGCTGHGPVHPREGRGDALYQERIPRGAPPMRAEEVTEICLLNHAARVSSVRSTIGTSSVASLSRLLACDCGSRAPRGLTGAGSGVRSETWCSPSSTGWPKPEAAAAFARAGPRHQHPGPGAATARVDRPTRRIRRLGQRASVRRGSAE